MEMNDQIDQHDSDAEEEEGSPTNADGSATNLDDDADELEDGHGYDPLNNSDSTGHGTRNGTSSRGNEKTFEASTTKEPSEAPSSVPTITLQTPSMHVTDLTSRRSSGDEGLLSKDGTTNLLLKDEELRDSNGNIIRDSNDNILRESIRSRASRGEPGGADVAMTRSRRKKGAGGPIVHHQSTELTVMPEKTEVQNVEIPAGPESFREKVLAVMDGRFVQAIMTILTVFALYGDDMRLKFFFMRHDDGFYAFYLITFILFVGELTVFTICKDDYKFSFFFYLDMIASLSLLIDIAWFMDAVGELFEGGDSAGSGQAGVARAGRASRAGTRAGRIVRLIRLVRLLRVVNITKLFSKEEKSKLDEDNAKAAAKTAGHDQNQEEGQKRVEASRLGKILSEQTTRTVILGVLCMMLFLPMIEIGNINRTPTFGLEQIFWMGRSQCSDWKTFFDAGNDAYVPLTCNTLLSASSNGITKSLNTSEHSWMQIEGFEYLLYAFTQQSRFVLGERVNELRRPILYLSVPIASEGGKLRPVKYVATRRCDPHEKIIYPFLGWDDDFIENNGNWRPECLQAFAEGKCCWQSHRFCTPDLVDDPRCPWREAEIEDVAFSPAGTCHDNSSCTHLTVYAKVLNRYKSEVEAEFNMIQTTFIVFLLAMGAMAFSKDTQQLVIAPIEKMVNIVKQLADDPLSKPKVAEEEELVATSSNTQLETSMLENTILKIGGLLQVGFGEAGAQIIGKNMASQDGELNILIPGRKIIAIFGFCLIRDFMDTTECLLEEVMVFVNKIARIVHICVHEWGGAANKNIGDSFLLTWIVNDNDEQKRMLRHGCEESVKMCELADKSLVAFVKVIAELRRASDLRAYTSHPKIQQKFLNTYEVKMAFGLHCGWAIEGAIGSEHKIDASYLSPHVNLCARLETATAQYGVDILFSEVVHGLLSTKAKDRCRKLDVVMVKGSVAPIGIYTLDLNAETVQAPDGHQPGEVITTGEISKESLFSKGVKMMFEMDQDILRMQEAVTQEFHTQWKQAFHLYINGAWSLAHDQLQRCSSMVMAQDGRSDGPSECLLAYISGLDYTPPPDWQGCRRLENK